MQPLPIRLTRAKSCATPSRPPCAATTATLPSCFPASAAWQTHIFGSRARSSSHLHIALSTAAGQVFGGHVAPGCIVRTTAEVLLALLPEWEFAREPDALTGNDELVVRPLEVAICDLKSGHEGGNTLK